MSLEAQKSRDGQPLSLLIGSLQIGGIQTSTLRLAEEFVRLGRKLSLIVVNAEGPMRAQLPAGCELVDLKAGHARQALPALVAHFRNTRPPIVLSAQTHINALAIAARMLAHHPKRLIVSERIAVQGALGTGASRMDRARPAVIRLLYRYADAVVAVSEDARRGLREQGGVRLPVHVIHNGVDVDRIRAQAQAEEAHPWMQSRAHRLVLGIGRLAPQKHFALLLRAFAALRGDEHRLIILGDGPERANLTVLARELGIDRSLDMPGAYLNPYPLLGRADVFVLPSRWEGFSNVVIEALACGTAIVATDCPGGPADVLEDGTYGRLVPVDDAPAMTEAIQQALTSPPDSEALVRHARNFSVQRAAQQYLELVESLHGHGQGMAEAA